MSNDEPETRHLCVAELREHLERARLAEIQVRPLTVTRISVDSQTAGRPTRGGSARSEHDSGVKQRPATVTEQALEEVLGTCPDDARTWIYQRKDLLPAGRIRPRRVAVRIVVAVALSLGAALMLAYLVHAAPPRSSNQAAPRTAPAQPSDHQAERAQGNPRPPAAESVENTAPAAVSPIDTRDAVDLLFSGNSRAALDAYRRLRLQVSTSAEFALAVRLLEREVARCGDANRSEGAACR